MGLGDSEHACHLKCFMYGAYPIFSAVRNYSCTGAEGIFRSICINHVSQSVCRYVLIHRVQSLAKVRVCSALFIFPSAQADLVFLVLQHDYYVMAHRNATELKGKEAYGVSGIYVTHECGRMPLHHQYIPSKVTRTRWLPGAD